MKITPKWQAILESALFAPLHPLIASLQVNGFPTLYDLNQLAEQAAIQVQSGCELRFTEQSTGKLSLEMQYEPRCYLTGEVQTRSDNWHDLFNAMIWLTYPKSKAAINARHYAAIMAHKQTRSQRGAVRDMNTLLDESGVIIACSDANLSDLLLDFKWTELFWQQRVQVKHSMGFYLFGHGLYEKALHPYLGMTGQGLILPVAQAFFSCSPEQQRMHLDNQLAEYLYDPEHCLDTRELTPVPLLGVPGWAIENDSEAYYDNSDYFRRKRQQKS
jgi:hypothetical protein